MRRCMGLLVSVRFYLRRINKRALLVSLGLLWSVGLCTPCPKRFTETSCNDLFVQ